MTRTEIERLAVVESQVETIASIVGRVESKLDDAIACKADKSEVDAIAATQVDHDRAINRLYGALALVSVGMPLVIWLLQRLTFE